MEQQNTALLVMDMQSSILGGIPDAGNIINQVSKAITAARNNNIPVIYVVVGFRQGAPEISPNNKGFVAAKGRLKDIDPAEWLKVHPAVAPAGNEITVIKRRVSAFTGSDLEVVLRAGAIQHLVLTGVSTSGVVLSTVREAADKDYRLTILEDCCADGDEEIHRVLTARLFPKQGTVQTLDAWLAS